MSLTHTGVLTFELNIFNLVLVEMIVILQTDLKMASFCDSDFDDFICPSCLADFAAFIQVFIDIFYFRTLCGDWCLLLIVWSHQCCFLLVDFEASLSGCVSQNCEAM